MLFRSWNEEQPDRKAISGPPAFSPNSELLAIERGDGVIRLEEVASRKELALLENPFQGRASYPCFSPDGTVLIATNSDHQMIHVWDLRKIRLHLAQMGLDWNAQPYPPEPPEQKRPAQIRPLEVQIVGIEATVKPKN